MTQKPRVTLHQKGYKNRVTVIFSLVSLNPSLRSRHISPVVSCHVTAVAWASRQDGGGFGDKCCCRSALCRTEVRSELVPQLLLVHFGLESGPYPQFGEGGDPVRCDVGRGKTSVWPSSGHPCVGCPFEPHRSTSEVASLALVVRLYAASGRRASPLDSVRQPMAWFGTPEVPNMGPSSSSSGF